MPRLQLLDSLAEGARMMASGTVGSHRAALLLSTGSSAALFAWAAWVLPSRPGSSPALLLALLAIAHVLTLLIGLLRPAQLRSAWRTLSWLSLGVSTLLVGLIGVTALQMVQRFGSLGVGVASLLGIIAVLALLATLPFAFWGLRATRSRHGSG